MKLIRILLVVVLILALIAVVLSAVAPTRLEVSRQIFVQAPLSAVWEQVSSLRGMDQWSPWNDLDTAMKKTFEGTDGTVGASLHWEGNQYAGSGRQTIARIEPLHRVDIHIQFLKPFQSEANSTIEVEDNGGGTRITWSFNSETPRPFNILHIFMNMEQLIGQDYEKGLQRLKNLVETNTAHQQPQP